MNHLSPERTIAIAEGAPMKRHEVRHCASCPTCTREISEVACLLDTVRTAEEPVVVEDLLEHNAARIDARIAGLAPLQTRRQTRPVRWGIVALPLAAAAVMVVLPRTRDTSVLSFGTMGRDEVVDLTSEQYDSVVYDLALPLGNLGMVETVLSSRTQPLQELEDLSKEELERLLDLMPETSRG